MSGCPNIVPKMATIPCNARIRSARRATGMTEEAMSTAELVKKPNGSELAPATPMDLLSVALNNNAAIDVIERLAALQEKALAREAEYQFNEAMSRVQKEVLMVAPDLQNPQTHSKYASYAAIDKVVRPVYTREGLSLSFDTGDAPNADCVRVVCYVSRGSH